MDNLPKFIAIDPATGLVVGAHTVPRRQHDRAPVPETLSQIQHPTGQTPRIAIADLGYRGKSTKDATRIITLAALRNTMGSTRKRLQRLLRRRQVAEATIGRLSSLHRLERNNLRHDFGNLLNVILAAAGNNFRVWLRPLCVMSHTAIAAVKTYNLALWSWAVAGFRTSVAQIPSAYAA